MRFYCFVAGVIALTGLAEAYNMAQINAALDEETIFDDGQQRLAELHTEAEEQEQENKKGAPRVYTEDEQQKNNRADDLEKEIGTRWLSESEINEIKNAPKNIESRRAYYSGYFNPRGTPHPDDR